MSQKRSQYRLILNAPKVVLVLLLYANPCLFLLFRKINRKVLWNKNYPYPLLLKKQQFKKDPDQFIHIDDIMMGVIVGDKGKGCIFGRFTIEEMKAAAWTLQHRFSNNVSEMEYMMDMKMKKEQGLVGADGKPIKPAGKIIT